MLTSAECRKYADECERIAREGAAQNTAVMFAIANAWRRCAQELERQENPAPQSIDGD
jgi:transcriptional regulator of acetoin/glycerol metabolism